MIIGIDASRAFSNQRTGIEEYSFQVIKNLINELRDDQVVLYVRDYQDDKIALPQNWKVKNIKWPFFWTQLGLSLEMLLHPIDVLFVPSHVVPFIHPARNASLFNIALLIQKVLKFFGVNTFYNEHSDAGGPKNTVVTIHGLEYEFFPEGYSFWERVYMRWSIKASCRWAKKIVAVSENTKKDLIKLYKIPEEKIEVVYEGVSAPVIASEDVNDNSHRSAAIPIQRSTEQNDKISESADEIATSSRGETPRNDSKSKYLLFIGRLEARKNIIGIIKAFEMLKEKHKIPHKLMLVGKFGHGSEKIKSYWSDSPYQSDVLSPGFVSEWQKQELLQNAEVFLFPSFYEGFGLPILEAQNIGVPVVTSNISSMPEIAGDGALFVDPNDPKQLAEAVYHLISDKALGDGIIKKGRENVQKLSWSECGSKIAKILSE